MESKLNTEFLRTKQIKKQEKVELRSQWSHKYSEVVSLLVILLCIFIAHTARAQSIEQYDVFELTFEGSSEGNPYMDKTLKPISQIMRRQSLFLDSTMAMEFIKSGFLLTKQDVGPMLPKVIWVI